MANEFDEIKEDGLGEDNFDSPPAAMKGKTELKPSDMEPGQYIKNPEIGQSILLDVMKVEKNETVTGKNKSTGEQFDIGLKSKNGVLRIDIICKAGTYTLSAWEIYYKLFGIDGVLLKYGKKHNDSYNGAQVKITKHFNGQYAQMPTNMVAKLMDMSTPDAEKYKADVAKAMKDKKLYTVEVLN